MSWLHKITGVFVGSTPKKFMQVAFLRNSIQAIRILCTARYLMARAFSWATRAGFSIA